MRFEKDVLFSNNSFQAYQDGRRVVLMFGMEYGVDLRDLQELVCFLRSIGISMESPSNDTDGNHQ